MIKLTAADKIIVLLSIVLLVFLFSYTWRSSNFSDYVSVYVRGEKRYIVDLKEEKTIEVEGVKGVSKLEVANGKVRFIESPCSSHFCIRSGWLSPAIGLIACLPNGISVQFSNRNKTYDAINF